MTVHVNRFTCSPPNSGGTDLDSEDMEDGSILVSLRNGMLILTVHIPAAEAVAYGDWILRYAGNR